MLIVTVIIPNFNHAAFLKQRIESVLNQTWQDFTIIILDDCSSDASQTIIEKYRSHPKVSAIEYNSRNSGNTFVQWEKGISLANTEYIWIAESDDWCEPTFLEHILTGMQNDPQCVVGFCQSACIRNGNEVSWVSVMPWLSKMIDGNQFVNEYMTNNTAIFNTSMAVWRRAAFANVSKEFTQYRYCGDWLFWIELCRQGNVFISGRVLNYFRKHKNDVSGKMAASGGDLKEEIRLFRLLLGRGWIEKNKFLEILKQKFVYYQSVKNTLQPADQKEVEDSFFKDIHEKRWLQRHYRIVSTRLAVKKLLKNILNS